MQLQKLLEKWGLTSLRIRTPFLEMDWQPRDEDKIAAWELYVELITRAATRGFDPDEGDEPAALKSIYDLFPLTRETIKRNGRYCINFTRITVVVLNQIVRPFTARWHPRILAGPLDAAARRQFRTELGALQTDLRKDTRLLADLAAVEDLTTSKPSDCGRVR